MTKKKPAPKTRGRPSKEWKPKQFSLSPEAIDAIGVVRAAKGLTTDTATVEWMIFSSVEQLGSSPPVEAKPPAPTDSKAMAATCKAIWRQIQKSWGGGWDRLSDDIKRAIITERVFLALADTDHPAITPDEMRGYLSAAFESCGIGQDVPVDAEIVPEKNP